METTAYVAKTMYGLEDVLANELTALGALNVKTATRAVHFDGDKKLVYQCCLQLRTALRILQPLATFKAKGDDELYAKAKKALNWGRLLDAGGTLAIDGAVRSPYFRHSRFAVYRLKDAVVDWFREHTGKRPSIDLLKPDLRINLHISDSDCILSLDHSGESLHRRGYRLQGDLAPLNEVLAAGMVLLSGWDGTGAFVDPMCGSGTLAIEAAMLANKVPPGLNREFGFARRPDFDAALWETVRQAAIEKMVNKNATIVASDKRGPVVEIARKNAGRAGVLDAIDFTEGDFFGLAPPESGGVCIMNPPYGERMEQPDAELFYKTVGDRLKNAYAGYSAWVLSSNVPAMKRLGLRTSRRITLYNGSLECKFYRYDLYRGSKRSSTLPVK